MKKNKNTIIVFFSMLIILNFSCSNDIYAQDKLGINSFDDLPKIYLKYENDKYLESFMDRGSYSESKYISKDENYEYTVEVKLIKNSNVKKYDGTIYYLVNGKPFKIKNQISFFILNGNPIVQKSSYANYNLEEILESRKVVNSVVGKMANYEDAEKNNPTSEIEKWLYFEPLNKSEKWIQFGEDNIVSISNNSIMIKSYDEKLIECDIKLKEIVTKFQWKDNGYRFVHQFIKNKIDTIEFYKIKNKYIDGKYVKYEFIKTEKSDLANSASKKIVVKKIEINKEEEKKEKTEESKEKEEGEEEEETEEEEEEEKEPEEVTLSSYGEMDEEKERNTDYIKVKKIEGFYANGVLEGDYYNYNNQYKNFSNTSNGKAEYKYLDSNFLNFYIQYKNGKKIKEIDYQLNFIYNNADGSASEIVQFISKFRNYDEKGELNGQFYEQKLENIDLETAKIYLAEKGNYVNGKKDGIWLIYHDEAPFNISSKKTYKNGIAIGVSEGYDLKGNITSKTVHKN